MIRQHVKITDILLRGGQISMKTIWDELPGIADKTPMSTHMWNIRNQFGAKIQVFKEGKNVIGYELLNPDEVRPKYETVMMIAKNPPITKTRTERKVFRPKPKPKLKKEEDEVNSWVDPDFDLVEELI